MLIDSLYTKEDVFLIDIDDGNSPDTSQIARFDKLSNVHIKIDSNISWGASGTLRKTIQGAFYLLDADKSWIYYIVISGQDLPLKSPSTIKERLARGVSDKTSYIRSTEVAIPALDDIPIVNTTNKCIMRKDRGHTRLYANPGLADPQAGFGQGY